MKNILVYLEANHDSLKRVSFELVSAAKKLGDKVTGVLINGTNAQAETVKEYGCADVVIVKHASLANHSSSAVASAIKQVAEAEGADCVLFPANSAGLEIAPRVAVKLSAGIVTDCVALTVEGSDVIAKKPVYAGKAQVKVKIETATKIFSLRPNVFTAVAAPVASVNIKEFAPNLGDNDTKAVVSSVVRNEGKLDVAEADVIVSAGRGIKGPENFPMVEDMAKTLNAAVGASRAVVDAGWRPHSEQVGQTGKTVSPTLYVACAISGAVQHLAGMSGSKVIVAINKDKDAPIFKVCDYGVVGDIFEVMPKLNEKLKAALGKNS